MKFLRINSFALIAALTLSACVTAQSNQQFFTVTDNTYLVGESSFVDPSAVIIGAVQLGEEAFIAPFTEVRAEANRQIVVNNGANFQDNEFIHANTRDVIVGQRVSVAHGATVINSTLGDFSFIGFNAYVEDAVIEGGAMVLHGARVVGVTIPADKVVPSGAVITEQSQTSDLTDVDQAGINFKNEVVEVNAEFAIGYHEMTDERGLTAVLNVGPNPITQWNRAHDFPVLGEGVVVDANARVIGHISLGAGSAVAAGASLRADEGEPMVIGAGAQIGPNVTFHALKFQSIGVGDNLIAGEHAVFHGPLTVGDNVTVHADAVVFRSTIGSNITIGEGALVIGVNLADGAVVPDGAIIVTQEQADALAPAGATLTSAPAPVDESVAVAAATATAVAVQLPNQGQLPSTTADTTTGPLTILGISAGIFLVMGALFFPRRRSLSES